jgi:hypothetical protein
MRGFLLLNVLSCPAETRSHCNSSSNLSKFINTNLPKTKNELEETEKANTKKRTVRLVENVKVTEEAEELVNSVEEGLQFYEPELADEGEGGTYFMKNKSGQKIAVFKPFDEQPQAENNPKKRTYQSPCLPEAFTGIKLEETHRNEAAAYLLDHEGFAGVPLTILVECTHYAFNSRQRAQNSPLKSPGSGARRRSTSPSPPSPLLPSSPPSSAPLSEAPELIFTTKVGSLQKYINYEAQSWDMGSTVYPAREVHRIGLLDIRLLNLDRHGGNMLVVQGESSFPEHWTDSDDDEDKNYHLVPIDHAFSLPDIARLNCSDLWFEWYNWPQTSQPFSEETLNYIERINIETDIDLLMELQVRRECIETMILTTSLLKFTALKMKMNLKEIARLIVRENPKKPSVLEMINTRVQHERCFSRVGNLSLGSDSKKLGSRSSTELPAATAVFPPKFKKSRSTSKLPPCKLPDDNSRSARSPIRRNPGTRPMTTKPELTKSISFDLSIGDERDLQKFVKLVQQIIEVTLPDIVSELPKSDGRIKKAPSMSNEVYLQQLIEGQLKI